MYTYNTSALPTLLYELETWAIIEKDKSTIKSGKTKFMRRRANYTWQNYKTNEGIVSELKINPGVQKIQNHVNKWIQNVRRMDRERLSQL